VAVEVMGGLGGAVITDTELLLLGDEVDMAHNPGEAMVHRSTEADTDRHLAGMPAGADAHRHLIKEMRPCMTMGMTGGLHLPEDTALASMEPDSNRPSPKPGVMMRTIRKLSFLAQNLRHRCRVLMMAFPRNGRWRWMRPLAATPNNPHHLEVILSMALGIQMLTLLACWPCNKREHRRAHTAKTSKWSASSFVSAPSNTLTPTRTYVPPRQAWNQGPGRSSPAVPSPLNVPSRPAELPSSRGSPAAQQAAAAPSEYYEDVDPRFAEPGIHMPTPHPIQNTNAYEDTRDIPPEPRSPAAGSDRSTFTSISQRGVNPRWDPPPPPMATRLPVNRQTDVLSSNPDFELPSRGATRNNAMVPGSAYPIGNNVR